MACVSEGTGELFEQLLAWELFGRGDFDPKALLRQVPLPDLAVVLSNLGSGPTPKSVSVDLVKAEHLYRTGKLDGDWEIINHRRHVAVKYTLRKEKLVENFVHRIFRTEAAA